VQLNDSQLQQMLAFDGIQIHGEIIEYQFQLQQQQLTRKNRRKNSW
jgi:hypothetical protein